MVALVLGQAANANPVGGTVSSGKATISTPTSGTVQIDQTTKIVIINWSSFNIAGGETTKFVQPNASAIAVNRIGGNDPSTILGSLLANGKVVLINGNGILFGKGATVNVGSLLATTSDASDADIASGKAKFDKAGNPNAQIINQGAITAASGGMVGLVAPAVSNSGTITAKLGTVQLGASNVFTVDFTGDGLVSFPVDGNVVAAAIDKNGKPVEALVVNDGKISGGTVILTARAAANLVTNVISMKGEIVATSAHQSGGKIVLDGGQSGDVAVAGALNASGTSGGSISVVSQGTTSISGTITAKNTTGKGGKIETSGHVLSIGGAKIDAGQGGSWLLDPYDLTVDATAAATIDTALDAGTNTTLQTEAGSASGAGVQNASGSGDIIIASALTWSGTGVLTIDAYRNVDINANIAITGTGGLAVIYGDTTSTGVNDGVPADGAFSFSNGGNVAFTTTSSGNNTALSFNGQAYTLENNIADLASAISSDASGFYALAKNYDATPDGTYTSAPISTTFTGTFNGLGNTISGLTIHSTATGADVYVGLFAQTNNASSKIEHLRLTGVDITSADNSGMTFLGALVGVTNDGSVNDVSVSGSVTGGANNRTGGMFGANDAAVSNSSADVTVVNGLGDEAGGIVGLNSGTLTNVTSTGSVTGNNGENWVGGLIGSNNPTGTVTNSHATGDVSTTGTEVGGLIGDNHADVTNSYATGTVSGSDYTGGLIGFLDAGTISASHATGTVTGDSNSLDVGGLVGVVGSSTQLTGSYAMGDVTGGGRVGGLAGDNSGTIDNSYATGVVTALRAGTGSGLSNMFAGGLVGLNYATISGSYATGAVNAGTSGSPLDYMSAGGLAGGSGGGSASIDSSYATGTVTVYGNNSEAGGLVGGAGDSVTNSWAGGAVSLTGSAGQIGGLIGGNSASVQYDYAIGSVTGSGDSIQAGGLVGGDSGTIDNTYATGGVNGTGSSAEVGGVVGGEGTPTDITNSYWDSTTTGQAHGIGAGGGTDTAGAVAVTSSTAYTQSTYGGLDFTSHWVVVDGDTRPLLRAEYSTTITDAHQLQLMALDLTANYTLANNIDASGTGNGSDVWLESTGFIPVGGDTTNDNTSRFTGSFDGKDHTISNLAINNEVPVGDKASFEAQATSASSDAAGNPVYGQGTNIGLFGYIGTTGTVSNVGIVGGTIQGSYSVGALAGENAGTITNAWASTTITALDTFGDGYATTVAGGLVGTNIGMIESSHASGDVHGGFVLGGLVGSNIATGTTQPVIENSYATGNVSGDIVDFDPVNMTTGDIGGLVGISVGVLGMASNLAPVLNNDYATGDVTGNSTVGGLVGYAAVGTISNSHATGAITGTGTDSNVIGGLIGYMGDKGGTGTVVSNSYAIGAVSGSDEVGGLVGGEAGGDTITQSYATGSVTATDVNDGYNVGGLVGIATGAIVDSYETGNVTGNGAVGGLVGLLSVKANNTSNHTFDNSAGSITDSYETGTVTQGPAPSGQFGGLVGVNVIGRLETDGTTPLSTTIADSYYNTTKNPATGAVAGGAASGVTGLSTTQMMDSSSFSWTFDTTPGGSGWVIVDSDGSLNNTGGTGATTPMLLSEYSTTITSAHQLQLMALDLTANYTLGNNVDAHGTTGGDVWGNKGFISVGGNGAGPFTGSLDGAGHAIENLYINSNNQQVGLFGEIGTPDASGGKVSNLAIIDADVTGTNPASAGAGDGIGVLAGEDFSTISNVFVSGTVQQSEHQGLGVSDANIGGLVGFFGSGNGAGPVISDSGADVSVNANGGASSAGGLVGYMYDGAAIERSYATGQVTDGADGYAGGLVGFTLGAVSIDKSYATGDVIAGQDLGIGGFIGYLDTGGSIDESYSAGDVHADSSSVTDNIAGGFAGESNGTIGGVVANYYNGGGINAGLPSVGTGDTSGAVGLTSLTTAGFAGWTFGGLGSGADWVMIDADGTINNAGAADAGTTPMLLSEYSTNITNAHQLQLMTLDLTANYNLANNINASGTGNGSDVWLDSTGFVPVGGDSTNDNTSRFTGSFDGNNHTITNLTIVDTVPAANEAAFKSVIDTANANLLSPAIYGQGTNVGLFGYVAAGGSVMNVGLVGGSVTGTYNVGALAGTSDGTIKNAHSSATVTGDDLFGYDNSADFNSDPSVGTFYGGINIGGLIGANTGLVDHAYATGDVSGASVVGGLAGGNFTDGTQIATIQNSYATGDVTGSSVSGNTYGTISFVGGLVGQSGTSLAGSAVVPVLLNDYATGNVTGNNVVGGLAGDTNSGTITNSYATGSVTGTGDDPYQIGGLIGFVGDQGAVGTAVMNSYATGAVSGSDTVGGLVGFLKGGDTISHSYATGSVTALDPNDGYGVGGLVGEDRGLIEYSYATGTVSGEGWVGGLVGSLTRQGRNPGNPIFSNTAGSITNSYALGSVHGGGIDVAGGFVGYIQSGTTISDSYSAGLVTAPSSFIGGFAGRNSGTITNSYWDTGTSGMAAQLGVGTIDGSNVANNAPGVTGKTTAQLQGSLQTGFDGSVWAIQVGLSYPYLQWQAANGAPTVVSGIVYGNEAGTTPLAGADINAVTSGQSIATVTSGANGYYYFMLAPNAIPSTGLDPMFAG